ncbi:MAG: FkbM family methyltransferase [Bacteriovoracaceae bacterium]|nr:FkbM family methyltransferase [Bacteriovoracaceae bacterium]
MISLKAEYHLRNHPNRLIRALFSRLSTLRDRLYKLLSFFLAAFINFLPNRIISMTKERITPFTKMPYDLPVKMTANSHREFRRAGFCFREESTTKWIEENAKKGGVLFDIGANVGAVSLLYAANVLNYHSDLPDNSIISFEPTPGTFDTLCKNIKINNFMGKILPMNSPMSNRSNLGFFEMASDASGTSGHNFSSTGIKDANFKNKTLRVPMISFTIDQLVFDFNLPSPDWLKIDVDGLDFLVLKGAKKVLESGMVNSILIEKNKNENDIREFLIDHGFLEVNIKERISEDINLRFDRS